MKVCGWCGLVELHDPRALFCSRICRQAAFRIRRRAGVNDGSAPGSGRFAYADPPYPGKAARYYGDQPTYAGEVDHRELVERLVAGGFVGWALSTSSAALRDVLPLCPADARVCAWTKPGAIPPATNGIHSAWEPVIVWGGRQRPPGVADWLRAMPARRGGTLPGRKPAAFAAWLFDLLGLLPGDALEDWYPGTGIIGRAWEHLSSAAGGDGSRRYLSLAAADDVSLRALDDASAGDLSLLQPADVSSLEESDASQAALGDASPVDDDDASPRTCDDVSLTTSA